MKRLWKLIGLLGGMGCITLGIFMLLSERPVPLEIKAFEACNNQQALSAAWEVRLERYYGDLREVAGQNEIYPFLEKVPFSYDSVAERQLWKALSKWPVSNMQPQGLVLSGPRCRVIAVAGDTAGFSALCSERQDQSASGFAVLKATDSSSSPLTLVYPEELRNHRDGHLWALYPTEVIQPFSQGKQPGENWALIDAHGRSFASGDRLPWAHEAISLLSLLHARGSGILPQIDGSILAYCTVNTGGSEPLLLCQVLYPAESSETRLAYIALGLGGIIILLAGLSGSRSKAARLVSGDKTTREQSESPEEINFRDILYALDDPVFVTDAEGCVVLANRAATELLQIREGGKPDRDLRVTYANGDCDACDFLSHLAGNPTLEKGRTILVHSQNRQWQGDLFVTRLFVTETGGGPVLFHLHKNIGSQNFIAYPSELSGETVEIPTVQIRALSSHAQEIAKTLPIGTPESVEEKPESTSSVMVIDIDETIRSLAERMLERIGFRCISMRTGSEAKRWLMENPESVDIAVIEIAVFDGNWLELVKQLRGFRPDLKVILMGSLAEAPTEQVLEEERIAGFLSKPFQVKSLNEVIQTTLGHKWPSGEQKS